MSHWIASAFSKSSSVSLSVLYILRDRKETAGVGMVEAKFLKANQNIYVEKYNMMCVNATMLVEPGSRKCYGSITLL